MPRLTPNQSAVLADWWNLIYDAAFGGYTTTDLNRAVKDLATEHGVSVSFNDYRDIATLYGYARRMANAAGELQAALPDSPITADFTAIPPWASDFDVRNTAPVYHVVFEFSYIDPSGELQHDYRTSVFEMDFPDTVGDLIDAVNEDAQAMADKYKVRLFAANILQIQTV